MFPGVPALQPTEPPRRPFPLAALGPSASPSLGGREPQVPAALPAGSLCPWGDSPQTSHGWDSCTGIPQAGRCQRWQHRAPAPWWGAARSNSCWSWGCCPGHPPHPARTTLPAAPNKSQEWARGTLIGWGAPLHPSSPQGASACTPAQLAPPRLYWDQLGSPARSPSCPQGSCLPPAH